MENFILLLLNIIAGFIIAALAGMGVGGGGLLVIWLTLVSGMPQLEAQGINLLFFIFASAASLLHHLKNRKPNLKITLIIAASGMVGTFFGYAAASAVTPDFLRKCFGALMIFSGISVFFKKNKENA